MESVSGFFRSRRRLAAVAGVTLATLANNLVTFLTNVVIARGLNPAGFGVFSLSVSVVMTASLVGDLGLSLSLVRLFNKHAGKPETRADLLGTVRGQRIVTVGVLAVVALPLGGALAHGFGLGERERFLFAFSLLTAGLLGLWSYLMAALQAYREFRLLTAAIVAFAGLRLLGFSLVWRFFNPNPAIWLLVLYTAPALFLGALGFRVVRRQNLRWGGGAGRFRLSALGEALGYGKWVTLSGIAYTFVLQSLLWITALRVSAHEVGILSAGLLFTAALVTLNTAVRTVLFPEVTSLESSDRMRDYLRQVFRLGPYYLVVLGVGLGVLAVLQVLCLGPEYRQGLPVFFITGGVLGLTLWLGLATMLIHTLMRPQVDALVNLGRLGLCIPLAYWLTPRWGAVGAAVAYGVALVVGEFTMYLYVVKSLRGA